MGVPPSPIPRHGERRLVNEVHPVERRQQVRRQVDTMSDAEKRDALYTNEKSGLPNQRAFDDFPDRRFKAATDVDGLKAINDKISEKAGDQLIQGVADVGHETVVNHPEVELYHTHGDEFRARSDNKVALEAFMADFREKVRQTEFNVKGADGKPYVVKGIDISYGIHENWDYADRHMKGDVPDEELQPTSKRARTQRGERGERGEFPPGVTVVPGQGAGRLRGVAGESTAAGGNLPKAAAEVAPSTPKPQPGRPALPAEMMWGNNKVQVIDWATKNKNGKGVLVRRTKPDGSTYKEVAPYDELRPVETAPEVTPSLEKAVYDDQEVEILGSAKDPKRPDNVIIKLSNGDTPSVPRSALAPVEPEQPPVTRSRFSKKAREKYSFEPQKPKDLSRWPRHSVVPRSELENQRANPLPPGKARDTYNKVLQEADDVGLVEHRARAVALEAGEKRAEADTEGEFRKIVNGESHVNEENLRTGFAALRRSVDTASVEELGRASGNLILMKAEASRTLGVRDYAEVLKARYRRIRQTGKEYPMTPVEEAAAVMASGPGGISDPKAKANVIRDHLIAAAYDPRDLREGVNAQDPDVTARFKARTEKAKKTIREQGVDPDPRNWSAEDLADREKILRFLDGVSIAQATGWDKFMEYWRNGLVSGIKTSSVNTISNLGNLAYRMGIEKAVEAAVKRVARGDKGAFEDLKASYLALRKGWNRAILNAGIAARTGRSVLEAEVSGNPWEGGRKWEYKGPAIGGKFGKIVRLPFKALTVADEFVKGIVGEMEAAAAASKIVRDEITSGKTKPEDRQARIEQLTTDMGSEAWQKALTQAEIVTFQEQMGSIGNHLLQLRQKHPSLGLLLPFVVTPWNVTAQGLRLTPLASLSLMKDFVHQWRTTGSARKGMAQVKDFDRRFAESVIAYSLMGAVYSMLADDDGKISITSSEQWTPGSRGEREARQRSLPTNSLKVGDKFYNIGRLEPLSTGLVLMRDLSDIWKMPTSIDQVNRTAGAVLHIFTDKTFLQQVGNLARAVTKPEEFGWENAAIQNIASLVPNIVRSTARSFDETQRETKVWGADIKKGEAGETKMSRFGKRVAYAALPAEANPFAPPARVQPTGEEMKKPGSVLSRLASPVEGYTPEGKIPSGQAALDRLLLKYSRDIHVDVTEQDLLQTEEPVEGQAKPVEVFVRAPDPSMTIRGQKVKLSDSQRHELESNAGELLRERLERENYLGVEDIEPTRENAIAVAKKYRLFKNQALMVARRRMQAQILEERGE